ncbi:hypothetical protein SAMN05421820_1157 [Pedobacter steynii]|uniref:Uncharacterized protein n=1 Tax=Pedobacter steynii TaxID=430522 RepID=A0A1H0JKQ6_9SPHI|nr:hypothetical protein SAMN05421820_1157 [Pedobacter steynii]
MGSRNAMMFMKYQKNVIRKINKHLLNLVKCTFLVFSNRVYSIYLSLVR